MTTFDYTIQHADGLHARPATMLATKMTEYDSSVIKVQKGARFTNGKSLMGLLTLNAHAGETVTVTVEGPGEQQVAEQLEAYMKTIL